MQFHQLRYAVAVADELHFTRAARRLHVAQPSLSRAVRDLERELGAPLFFRERHAVALTAAGSVFLPWARQLLADADRSRVEVRELLGLERGRLALGATPSLTTGLLPPVLASFHQRYPGVELVLQEAGSGDLVAALEVGSLDVALVILPVQHASLSTVAVAEEELVLAVGPDHPLAERAGVAVADLRDLPLVVPREGYEVRGALFSACRAAGFEPTLAVDGGEMDGMLALAGAGLGAALVPSTAVPTGSGGPLRTVRFLDSALTRTLGLAERSDRPRSRAVAAFTAELSGLLGASGWPGGQRPGLRVLPAVAFSGRSGLPLAKSAGV